MTEVWRFRREVLAVVTVGFLWMINVGSFFLNPGYAGQVLNEVWSSDRPFNHQVFENVLMEYVDGQGHVSFPALLTSPRRLNHYMDQLAAVSPESHSDLFPSTQHRMAYWINAYNALALRLILDYYPIKRLEDIPGGLRAFRNGTRYRIGGKPYSLIAIERQLMTTYFDRPEIFFAVTDLSQSAPLLGNHAYHPETLGPQLTKQAETFIRDTKNVTIQSYCGPMVLSPVFKQFQPAFTRYTIEHQGPLPYSFSHVIKPYVTADIRGYLSAKCDRTTIFYPFDNRLRDPS